MIEKERRGRFHHVVAQLFPGIRLREDIFLQAFGTIPAICRLNDFKNQFCHVFMIRYDRLSPAPEDKDHFTAPTLRSLRFLCGLCVKVFTSVHARIKFISPITPPFPPSTQPVKP